MRLIDGDELIEHVYRERLDSRELIAQMVESAPTIEPERKKGKWVVYKAPDKYHCGLVKCPFCREELIAEADEYNYCPRCGADLREEGEQNAD